MNLTRKQIKLLSEGSNEIADLTEEIKDEKMNEYKNKSSKIGDAKSFFNRKKPMSKYNADKKSSESFYQLFSIPGIKMTDKARKKFIDSKKKS